MAAQAIATLFSMWLTPMTIIACLFVVLKFYPAFKAAINANPKSEMNWFIIGIVIGFVGDLADNLYWAVAWSADYMQLQSRDVIFAHGVYSNSIFRQGCGVAAALCHLRGIASLPSASKLSLVLRILIYGAALGFVFVALLMNLRI